jgi:hypothetical protein
MTEVWRVSGSSESARDRSAFQQLGRPPTTPNAGGTWCAERTPMDVVRSHVNSVYMKRILRRVDSARLLVLVLVDSSFAQDLSAQQAGSPPATTAPAAQATQPSVTCASKVGERQECPADTSKGVVLARSYGAAALLLGKRQDAQLQKFFLPLSGWFLTPKFRYYLYVWSSNPSQSDPAQVVGAGNISYVFNKYVIGS